MDQQDTREQVKSTSRRRRSFANKTFKDGVEKSRNSSTNMEEWKSEYVKKLEREQIDLKQLFRDTKYKYKTLEKSRIVQFFDKSQLTPEDKENLYNAKLLNEAVGNLAKNVDKLIKVEEIKKECLSNVQEKKAKIAKFNECNLADIKHDIHTRMIKSDFDSEKLNEEQCKIFKEYID